MTGLPEGWVLEAVGKVSRYFRGVTYDKTQAHSDAGAGRVTVLRANNLMENAFELSDLVYIDERAVSTGQLICAGDIVFAMSSGSKRHVGKSVLATRDMSAAFGAFCGLLRPNVAIAPAFLAWQFHGHAFRKFVEGVAMGTNINNLKSSELVAYEVVIAPLPEQHRIVAKIEELFSELDAGTASLTRARAQLKTYRQALLKAAFEGKLTAPWRAAGKPWRQTRLGDEITFLTSGSRGWAHHYADQGEIFIRAQNLKHDRLDLTDIAYVQLPAGATEGLRTRVQIGDVLVTITGANVTKTGMVNRDLGTAYVSQHVALCRPGPNLRPEFLYWYLLSEAGGHRQLNAAAYGAGKPGLNLENIREVTLRLPCLEEQDEIIAHIGALLSDEEDISQTIHNELTRITALRQSILKRAFSGQLVAQDPADEPASTLLARLAQAPAPKPRRKTKP
jgi:type I restriction enzyme, S subunit